MRIGKFLLLVIGVLFMFSCAAKIYQPPHGIDVSPENNVLWNKHIQIGDNKGVGTDWADQENFYLEFMLEEVPKQAEIYIETIGLERKGAYHGAKTDLYINGKYVCELGELVKSFTVSHAYAESDNIKQQLNIKLKTGILKKGINRLDIIQLDYGDIDDIDLYKIVLVFN